MLLASTDDGSFFPAHVYTVLNIQILSVTHNMNHDLKSFPFLYQSLLHVSTLTSLSFPATGEPNIYRKPPIYKRHGSVVGPPCSSLLAIGHGEMCASLVLVSFSLKLGHSLTKQYSESKAKMARALQRLGVLLYIHKKLDYTEYTGNCN